MKEVEKIQIQIFLTKLRQFQKDDLSGSAFSSGLSYSPTSCNTAATKSS